MIASERLQNQQLFSTTLQTPQQIVEWMGAIQAQDYNMAKWAVGLRLPNSTDKIIETAINNAEIVRLHILRPTWHFVSANDIHWMLDLSCPRVKMQIRSSDRDLGITPELLSKIYPHFEKMLEGNNHLTRQEIADRLIKEGFEMETRRITHVMYHAELEGIVCNGMVRGKEQTYALLNERVTRKNEILSKEEMLEKLAQKYFRSHSPATLEDFIWWSGLTVGEARTAMEAIKNEFVLETIGDRTFYISSNTDKQMIETHISLIPAYDEYIVSYKNREEIFTSGNYEQVVHGFGLFRPAIAQNGHLIGTWKCLKKKNGVEVETSLFRKIDKATQKQLEIKIEEFKAYCTK